MILNSVKPNIEAIGLLNEKFFSIADLGMVFDILRNKMYSNPILAICREISCNARDAHREVNKAELPIEITLPTHLEKYYKIKDFGPGISPDRVENIFIKYAASTKRNDNIQTGSYGIGSKSPFAYTDSFSIITNFNGTQYNYNCFIDQSKVGKLALAFEAPTKEPNGTTIIIPVQDKDIKNFAIYTEQACYYWDIKPTILGGEIVWQSDQKILEGDRWNISAYFSYNDQDKIQLIIDGIQYPLKFDALKQIHNDKLVLAVNGIFRLYFGNGELSLSANREQIFLDDKTKNTIRQRFLDLTKELTQQINSKIAIYENLWDANIYYNNDLKKIISNTSFLHNTWRDIPLQTIPYISISCNVFNFVKGKGYRYRHRGQDLNKPEVIRRRIGSTIYFNDKSILVINNLPLKDINARHVKKIFDENPDIKNVQVIMLGSQNLDDLNAKYHFDLMKPRFLSEFIKARKTTNHITRINYNIDRLIIYKFIDKTFQHISFQSMKADTNQKVLCLFDKYNSNDKLCKISNGTHQSILNSNQLKYLTKKHPNVSFYGVDSSISDQRLKKEFANIQRIESFIGELLHTNNTNYLEIKVAVNSEYLNAKYTKYIDSFQSLIKNPRSLFLTNLQTHHKLITLKNTFNQELELYEIINGTITEQQINQFIQDNPQYNLQKLNQLYHQRYPLIDSVQSYDYKHLIPHLAQYINLIDSNTKENDNDQSN